MDTNGILTAILIGVFIIVGVALVFLLIEVVKTLRKAQDTIDSLEPTLKHVDGMMEDLRPTVARLDPMTDRLMLTVDSVNLEMMRVDKILEDVTEITNAASSATSAVDNITSAPLKAVNSVASRVKTAFGGKGASDESAKLAEQRVAVAKALQDYEAVAEKQGQDGEQPQDEAEKPREHVPAPDPQPQPEAEPDFDFADAHAEEMIPSDGAPKSYVKANEGEELVIDPKVIADSPFFSDDEE